MRPITFQQTLTPRAVYLISQRHRSAYPRRPYRRALASHPKKIGHWNHDTDIQQIVFNAIEMVNNLRIDEDQIPVEASTELFGPGGHLDSMGLVGLLLDIEKSLDNEGYPVSLSDDRAMSQRNSPFQNVQSLVTYIEGLLPKD